MRCQRKSLDCKVREWLHCTVGLLEESFAHSLGDLYVAYLEQYRANKPGLEAVKNIADEFMANFEAAEEEEIERLEELKNQVDDDGFVTVVSSKRKKPLPEEFIQPVKKQKSKELENFYRFQMREKKRDRKSPSLCLSAQPDTVSDAFLCIFPQNSSRCVIDSRKTENLSTSSRKPTSLSLNRNHSSHQLSLHSLIATNTFGYCSE